VLGQGSHHFLAQCHGVIKPRFLSAASEANPACFQVNVSTLQRENCADPRFTFAAMGRVGEARQVIAELAEAPGQKDILMIGFLYGALGDEEKAMDWLERAYEERVD
jgi:hypothetical protein